jgi:hypothetical protein
MDRRNSRRLMNHKWSEFAFQWPELKQHWRSLLRWKGRGVERWRGEGVVNGELLEPAILAQEAIGELEAAIAELQRILQELGEDISL